MQLRKSNLPTYLRAGERRRARCEVTERDTESQGWKYRKPSLSSEMVDRAKKELVSGRGCVLYVAHAQHERAASLYASKNKQQRCERDGNGNRAPRVKARA